jgi:NAD-dependent deacetylase
MIMGLDAATRILRKARSALFITGAGLSEESGMPSYRGIGGLWEDPSKDEHPKIEFALSESMFSRQPEITWQRIGRIQEACRGVTFNAAHAALARLEARIERAWVLTQNVDGLHEEAGSRNVIALHGDLWKARCSVCSHEARVTAEEAMAGVPPCPRCGATLRPDLLLAGERTPSAKTAQIARELERGFSVVMAIGLSRLEPNVTHPVLLASVKGVPTIELNLAETTLSDTVAVKLSETAMDALSAIMARLEG